MKRTALIAALCLACGVGSAQLTDEQCKRSLVAVAQRGGWFNRVNSHGTAFFISKDRLLTAAHIARGASYVIFNDGTTLPCTVESCGTFEGCDYATLRVPGANGLPLKLAKGAAAGTGISCYGDFNYQGGGVQVTVGQVACDAGFAGMRYGTANAYPGFSGGCCVNSAGNVVGIVSRNTTVGQYVMFLPIERVQW